MQGDGFSGEELTRRWALVLPHRDRAYRVARARACEGIDADDLVHEALVRAVTLPELKPESIGGLVSTIIMNLVRDVHRRATTAHAHAAKLHEVLPDIAETICDLDQARWIHRSTDGLTPADREAFLHRLAGHTTSTAAAELGITYKAAEVAYGRARAKLLAAVKTTLGIIGVLIGALRRPLGRAAPAALTAAAAIATLSALLLSPFTQPDGTDTDAQPVMLRAPHTEQLPSSSVARTSATKGKAGRTGNPQPSSTVAPTGRTVLDTGAMGTAKGAHGQVIVEERNPDETTLETVQHCLRDGIILTPTYIGCKSSSAR